MNKLDKSHCVLIKISLNIEVQIDNKSALVQIMDCLQKGDRPLPETIMTQFSDAYNITRPQWVNTLRPEQNGHHFGGNECTFVNENYCVFIEIALKFIPEVPIDNKTALVEVMD